MSSYYQNTDAVDGLSGDSQGGSKRKRDDGSGIQHRTKRNRYISIACNECKRRKIKCNGETPCQRCGNLNLDCIYSPNCCSNNFRDSPEFKQLTSQVNSLQDQVNDILNNLNSLRSNISQDEYSFGREDSFQYREDGLQAPMPLQSTLPIDPALQNRPPQQQPPPPPQQQPRFHMESSSQLNMDLAPNLRNAEEAIHQGVLSQADGHTQTSSETMPGSSTESVRDPIWSLSKDEAIRLCQVFEVEVGAMYPIVDTDRLKRHATMLFKFIDAVSRTFVMMDKPGPDAIHDQDTDLLKLVFAVALTGESSGKSELGRRLFEFVDKDTNSRLLGNVNVKDIQILTLTALYHLYRGYESLARRVASLTARLCLELGLHRTEMLIDLSGAEVDNTVVRNLFWSIYILDHTWSLNPGLSVAIQDTDVDVNFPRPTEPFAYLDTMIDYARLCDEVRGFVSTYHTDYGIENTGQAIDEFNTKVSQWQNSIPEELQFNINNEGATNYVGNMQKNIHGSNRHLPYQLQSLLYLRANYLRTYIYRTIITSKQHPVATQQATSSWAAKALETANDSIRVLSHFNSDASQSRINPVDFDNFLLGALATIFLAVSFAPITFTVEGVTEFYNSLELVRQLPLDSRAGQRLSAAVGSLKTCFSKIELFADFVNTSNQNFHLENDTADVGSSNEVAPPDEQQTLDPSLSPNLPNDPNEAQRSAAMAMAGLAGHTFSNPVAFAVNGRSPGLQALSNKQQPKGANEQSMESIANDLALLFQAVTQPPRSSSGRTASEAELKKAEGKECRARAAELTQVLKELF